MIPNIMPWVWLGVCVVCVVVEALTLALTTVWFAIGALAMIFVSMLRIPLQWQVVAFAAVSILMLVATRPLALKKFKVRRTATNSDRIIGQKVLVSEPVSPMQKGAVKVNGIVWAAQSEDESLEISVGSLCEITAIHGATAVIRPI